MHKEVLSGLFIKETICFCKIIERFNTIILIKMKFLESCMLVMGVRGAFFLKKGIKIHKTE